MSDNRTLRDRPTTDKQCTETCCEQLELEIKQLQAELATARETNKALHRRCQLAESAVKENIAECKRHGQSLGRRLSAAGYLLIEAELATAKEEVEDLRKTIRAKDTIIDRLDRRHY